MVGGGGRLHGKTGPVLNGRAEWMHVRHGIVGGKWAAVRVLLLAWDAVR